MQAEYDGFDDLVTVTGQGMLGLTFNCARCHDHKIDPIPQRDYYQLVAFFRDVTPYGSRGDQAKNNQIDISPPELRSRYQELDKKLKDVKERINKLEQLGILRMKGKDQRKTETEKRSEIIKKYLQEHLEAEEWESYQSLKDQDVEINAALKALPAREFVLGLAECLSQPPKTHVLLRGSPQAEGEIVQPGFPAMIGASSPEIPDPTKESATAGRRKVLAQWITDKENWFYIARDREPTLATSFRARHRSIFKQLRPARRFAQPS